MKFACYICEKTVADDHNTICCDIYNKWVHVSCNNISRYCFRKFQKSSTPWYCENCLKQVLPFNKRTDYQLKVLVLGKVLTSPKLLFFNFLFIYLFQMKNVKMQPKLNWWHQIFIKSTTIIQITSFCIYIYIYIYIYI